MTRGAELRYGRTEGWCGGGVDAAGLAGCEMGKDSLDDLGDLDARDDAQRTAEHATTLGVDVDDSLGPLHPAHGGRASRKGLAGSDGVEQAQVRDRSRESAHWMSGLGIQPGAL